MTEQRKFPTDRTVFNFIVGMQHIRVQEQSFFMKQCVEVAGAGLALNIIGRGLNRFKKVSAVVQSAGLSLGVVGVAGYFLGRSRVNDSRERLVRAAEWDVELKAKGL